MGMTIGNLPCKVFVKGKIKDLAAGGPGDDDPVSATSPKDIYGVPVDLALRAAELNLIHWSASSTCGMITGGSANC